jgi:predicted nucleic-acid-binding Zn-ribbon protein
VCGEPVRLASEKLLRTAFGCIKEETRQLLGLCERCRRRELQQKLIAALGDGKAKTRDARLL